MRIDEMPVVDVRGQLTAQRRRLLSLLTSLSEAQWAAPTAAPQWSVKDVAPHLLDVDLSWVARARVLSPQLIADLLRWAGEQLDDYLASLDLGRSSSVYWAGDVPLWFDMARPAGDGDRQDEYLPLVP
jgi:Mycothiol maleylpyruvate isomerase N-terminal domain